MKSFDHDKFDKEFNLATKVFKYVFITMAVLFPIFFVGIIAMNVYVMFYAPCETVRGLPITSVPVRCL